ncbi:response regulator [Psychrobacter sp. 1U1]|uniref:response regulator n=2 Tax=unclassified Psychrobacter TaxID=196806 RepID=UPI003F447449
MQQFQSLKRLLLFYILTLLIMLALYYAMMLSTLKTQSQTHSQVVFAALKHEIINHAVPTETEIENIVTKPFFQDISYQLIFMLPSGQTYVYHHIQPQETEFTSVTFPTLTSTSTTNNSSYQIDNDTLTGRIKLENGHQIYVVLRHQPLNISWISYQFWLPLMTAIMLFSLALLYALKRRTNWEQLIQYTDSLTISSKEAYIPPPFVTEKATPEFLRLGHTLSRISYQLHDHHRRIKILNQRLEHLVNQAPLPMLMVMRQGHISFFNQRFEQVFTTAFQRHNHYSLTDFLTGSDKATQQLLQKLSTLRVTRNLLVYGLEDRQAYQLHITPWFGAHGQVHGFTVILNNIDNLITQADDLHLQNQQLQLQIKEFTKLRSIIGHELRTPLNAIIGTLGLIEAHRLTPRQQEVLSMLTQSSQSMLAMLNDMLDMAKIKAGKADIVNEPTDIFKLGQHVSDLMIGSARRQGINLLYFFMPDSPRYISTDGNRLRQILLNLLDNATKFTSSGYVALVIEPITYEQMRSITSLDNKRTLTTIARNQNLAPDNRLPNTVTNTGAEHQWMRFSVKDTGIGIAESEQDKLFSYFNQANRQISQNFGGTGLGLAISNSFAQLLGGFIQLDSELDVGSNFALYLPCQQPTYQPIYHFHSSLMHIRFIVIVEQDICVTFFQHLCSHLSLPVSIYTDLDDKTAQKLYKQLELEAKTLQPILLLDYEYYETYTHLAPVTGATDDPSIGNQQRLVNSEQSQVIHKLLNVTSLPKLLLSMKPERSIPSSFLDQFDGFLNKPLDVALLLSELIRLLQSTTVSHKHEDTGKTSESTKKPTMDNNTVEVASAPTILVVDDNLTNQKITCKMLDKLGYPSLVADDGRQALEQLDAQRQQISLILMDCRMPVMDGLQATQVIRSQGNSIPIVALTANNTEEDREACRQAGMDDFLAKPINKDKLKTVLQRLMTTE